MHTHSPGWFVVSYKATTNIGYSALIPAIVLTTLALVSVILRWYTRAFLLGRISHEDIVITAALILSIAMTGVVVGEFQLDTGNLNNEIRTSLLTSMMKLVFVHSIFFHACINLVKASIVIQYVSIFSSTRIILKLCYLLLFLITAASAWGILGVVFLCRPIRKYWHPQIRGTCMDPEQHFWSSAIFGIILDYVIWLLPVPVIGKLKLQRRQRVGLFIVFGLGSFVCIVSVLRLTMVHNAAEHEDVTKSGTYAVIWSATEVNVAIICASFLVMRPLLVRFCPSLDAASPSKRLYARQTKDSERRWPSTMALILIDEDVEKAMGSTKAKGRLGSGSTEREAIAVPDGAASIGEEARAH